MPGPVLVYRQPDPICQRVAFSDPHETMERSMAHVSDSIEAVAYALLERVSYAENKDIGIGPTDTRGGQRPDRHWILSTYAECLRTVRTAQASAARDDTEAREGYAGFREVPREAILASAPI